MIQASWDDKEILNLTWKWKRWKNCYYRVWKCETEKQDKNREISLSGIETSLNEISHVFIRGRGKGLVKIYTEKNGGDISRKRKYHSAFSSRANSLKSQTFSRLCLGNIPGEETRAHVPLLLPFLPSSYFYSIFLLE